MAQIFKCPKCGKTNTLVKFEDFRYPFQRLPEITRQQIIKLTEEEKDFGIMVCPNCMMVSVFSL